MHGTLFFPSMSLFFCFRLIFFSSKKNPLARKKKREGSNFFWGGLGNFLLTLFFPPKIFFVLFLFFLSLFKKNSLCKFSPLQKNPKQKKMRLTLFLSALVASALGRAPFHPCPHNDGPDRFLVSISPVHDPALASFKRKAGHWRDIEIEREYGNPNAPFHGVVVFSKGGRNAIDKILDTPGVIRVEQDCAVSLPELFFEGPPGGRADAQAKPGSGGGGSGGQAVDWGIDQVFNGKSRTDCTGFARRAWIIDTGIDLDHPDLNVDQSISFDALGSRSGADDLNGHGTHVAGTIAAIDNSAGTVGVCPGATVVSVRVLDRRGSGSYSGVIAGIDFVAANADAGDVANLSLGGPPSDLLDDAIKNLAGQGVLVSLAAGNEGSPIGTTSPARIAEGNVTNVFAVGAHNINFAAASFSNYGTVATTDVVSLPGVSINSLWKSGGTNTISGTSMAAPHLAGIMLRNNGASFDACSTPRVQYPVFDHETRCV